MTRFVPPGSKKTPGPVIKVNVGSCPYLIFHGLLSSPEIAMNECCLSDSGSQDFPKLNQALLVVV